ncbi:MAG: hypothetical protein GY906_00075 [bacterium]|nr:hypothetical protein [bacterium]
MGDPLITGVAWLIRAARSEQRQRQRLRALGPERPDQILQQDSGGLVVLCSREKAEWDERVTIQFREGFFRLDRVEERPHGEWVSIAYVLRPTEPGEIIRGLVHLEEPAKRRPVHRPRT